jgi:hypothetical protein
VPASDRSRLEHLERYVLRPPVAQDALELTPDRKILLTMRRAWDDGTRAILFEPHELIEKLAALVPRPRINLLLYHGVFGPSARLRSRAVAAARSLCASEARDGSPAARNAASTRIEVPTSGLGSMLPGHTIGRPPLLGSRPAGAHDPAQPPERSRSQPRPHTPWAELLRRTFEIDVLACPDCGRRLRLLATIEDSAVARRILSHLGLTAESPEPLPARSPPNFTGLFDSQLD